MLHPRKYREGTRIETLPFEIQEEIARRNCPYTLRYADPPGVIIDLPGVSVYLRVPRGQAEPLRGFVAHVRKEEAARWRGDDTEILGLELPSLSAKYIEGYLYVYYPADNIAAIAVCPLLLDYLDNLANYL